MSIELKQAAQQALEATSQFVETELTVGQRYTNSGQQLLEAIEALRTAITQASTAESGPVARAWAEGYRQGIEDERISEANIGIAGFGAKVNPNRENPYANSHPAPGVPVGQAPSVWNSIQIASWIGSQLMREPSTFERNAVCKFVRSLGRHPTLLKHSPKDTHPAPGVPDDVVRGAISTVREQYRGTDWGKAAECICDAIDAAMLTAAQAQKGQP